jgi:4-hydroxy-tetrahydrodipicolinate synthase
MTVVDVLGHRAVQYDRAFGPSHRRAGYDARVPIEGIITAMVTPFDARGRVAEDAAAALVRHLLDSGSDGLVVAGTTGEGSTLSDAEKLRLCEIALAGANGAPIIAATGSNDTAHSVELTERVTELGVDGVLVVTPYYNKPNPRGILAHFRAVAAATDKPVVVYNIPSRCVVDIPNALLRELAEIPNVAAVKQARFHDIEPIEGLDLLAGNDEVLAEVLDKGGTGGILVASHLVGAEMRRMIDEPEARAEIHESLLPLFAAMGVTTNPIPVKTALALLGHEVGGLRLPMIEASAEEEAAVRGALERHGLLSTV